MKFSEMHADEVGEYMRDKLNQPEPFPYECLQ